jgi:hypothetical protein
MQTPNHWPQAQIFDESAKLDRNTVNGCFPGRNGKNAKNALREMDLPNFCEARHKRSMVSCAIRPMANPQARLAPPFALLSVLRKPLP